MAGILAIETSTVACSVALSVNGTIDERFVVAAQQHTQRLLPMVDELLSANKIKLNELDAIAYSSGPGSFTGLRICLGVVQGLAFGANLPLVKVSSLELLAFGIARNHQLPVDSLVMPTLDAHMGEIYWAVYRYQGDGVQSVLPDSVNSVTELFADTQLETLCSNRDDSTLLVVGGDGCKDLISANSGKSNNTIKFDQQYPQCYPRAADLAYLAIGRWQRAEVESVFDAAPTYIRNETTWKKRQRIRSIES